MNYIQKIQNALDEELKMGETYVGLLETYGLLVLTVGVNCTQENIHDAWSIWQNKTQPEHRSLIPFNKLTKEVQELDEEYRLAVVKVALSSLDKPLPDKE